MSLDKWTGGELGENTNTIEEWKKVESILDTIPQGKSLQPDLVLQPDTAQEMKAEIAEYIANPWILEITTHLTNGSTASELYFLGLEYPIGGSYEVKGLFGDVIFRDISRNEIASGVLRNKGYAGENNPRSVIVVGRFKDLPKGEDKSYRDPVKVFSDQLEVFNRIIR